MKRLTLIAAMMMLLVVQATAEKPKEYGKLDCVEVDIHYYRQHKISGKTASGLSFYSVRAYGDDIIPFMKSIPERRQAWYDAMIQLDLQPEFPGK